MAEEEKKDPGGKKLDRREILQGLSTVPVAGIFGYALKKQIGYEKQQAEAASPATPAPPDRSASR